LRDQLLKFPIGHFVAVYEGRVVGCSATFRIPERFAVQALDRSEIIGGGFASRHEPDGDWLCGMEVFVDQTMRGSRIGQGLYKEGKHLCTGLGLKGIVFGGRLPGLSRRWKKIGSAEACINLLKEKKITGRVLSFQLRN
jgi:hypothetical protein